MLAQIEVEKLKGKRNEREIRHDSDMKANYHETLQ
jgi:hypothetical protein